MWRPEALGFLAATCPRPRCCPPTDITAHRSHPRLGLLAGCVLAPALSAEPQDRARVCWRCAEPWRTQVGQRCPPGSRGGLRRGIAGHHRLLLRIPGWQQMADAMFAEAATVGQVTWCGASILDGPHQAGGREGWSRRPGLPGPHRASRPHQNPRDRARFDPGLRPFLVFRVHRTGESSSDRHSETARIAWHPSRRSGQG